MEKKIETRIHKFKSSYGLLDYYKHHKSKRKQMYDAIDYKMYSKVLNDIMVEISNSMTSGMYDFKLPYGLGKVITRKYIPTLNLLEDGTYSIRRAIDWKETNKMWDEYPELRKKQFVYHMNDHSRGFTFTVSYRKEGSKFRNRIFYCGQINRSIKRTLAKKIREGSFDALETNNK